MNLSYGNKPPARATIRLGSKIRPTILAQMIACQHEAWVNSMETCGGLIYIGDLEPLTTTSSVLTYASSNGWGLERFLPYIEFEVRTNVTDEVFLLWKAFVRNLTVQVEVLYADYTSAASVSTATATDNGPQWIGSDILITDLDSVNGRVLRVSINKEGFAADGELFQFAARSYAPSASVIPGQ